MQGPAPHDTQRTDEAAGVCAAMSPEAVDNLLAELGTAAIQVLSEAEAVVRRKNELRDIDEDLIDRRHESGANPYAPDSALASVRARLAGRSAVLHGEAAREFVAWWADAATVALVTAACRASPHEYRMVAANPEVAMDDEGLAQLPEVPERSRQLIELGAHMHDNGDGLWEMVTDLATRCGMRIGQDADGEVSVYEDGFADSRRHRLWGDHWADHRVPALPTCEQLSWLLADAPPGVLVRLQTAIEAIDATLVAKTRAERLEAKNDPWTAEEIVEHSTLSGQVDGLTRLLADYAQAAAAGVPAARAMPHRDRREAAIDALNSEHCHRLPASDIAG
ncbi:hypothetical protein [Streptomyces zagrosensis]|uniref:Uncharacterized protein n=1 Tax=Streptomyces zagrosensis TaxID=1042984 RepID=A0A7W9Q684_9ACTN|nr:hypothetical protein [Streptomyces zagrosensis]MBB5934315.1 hypothetical protein [Streptomyces zagrosensis]